ncbi:MAG: hypothetical protein QOJ65_821 [Fimbriimonadaceae bacterium]|nr:hypothetical protein [Fimbriimonadaceae bacterium]
MKAERRLPIATLLLIAANVGVAYLTLLHPEFPVEYGFRPEQPSLQTALECLFIHSNIVHLLGNMIFLAAVGATVEQLSGSFRFAIVYFASGLAGVAVHWIFASKGLDSAPLVGASGCIAGCAAYYSVRYMKMRVPMAPHVGASVAGVTVFWLLLQIVGAFWSLGEQKPVTAYWAHIGGFVMGLLLSVSFKAPDPAQIEADRETLKEMGERSPGAVLAAAEQQLAERPNDLHALQELAMVHRQMGDADKEAAALYRLLEVVPEEKQGPLLERMCAIGAAGEIPPHRRLALAERHKTDEPAASAALVQSVLKDPAAEGLHPDAMLALASLQMESAPDKARALLAELERRHPLHPATEVARAKGLL